MKPDMFLPGEQRSLSGKFFSPPKELVPVLNLDSLTSPELRIGDEKKITDKIDSGCF
jgi:hypothetical protein